MTAPGNNVIQWIFAVAFVIATGYAVGRLHQWYRDGTDRDAAYRDGYDQASDRLFDLATRPGADPGLVTVEVRPTDDPPPVPARPAAVLARPAAVPARPARRPGRRTVGDCRRRIGSVGAGRPDRENVTR